MTQTSINYARVLYDLGMPRESLEETYGYVSSVPELLSVLMSPVAKREEKQRVIDRIFPEEMRNFLKVLCDNHDAYLLEDIFRAYEAYSNEMQDTLQATLYYVTMPGEKQLEGIKSTLCGRYDKRSIKLSLAEDKSLIGGFVIRCGDREIDYSLKGRLNQLEQKIKRR